MIQTLDLQISSLVLYQLSYQETGLNLHWQLNQVSSIGRVPGGVYGVRGWNQVQIQIFLLEYDI